MSLASRTHLEVLGLGGQVLGLGLEASSPRLEDSTIFCTIEILLEMPETLWKICADLFCFPKLEIA